MVTWEASGSVDTVVPRSPPVHAPLLVVDDDKGIRESLHMAAEVWRYPVEVAASVSDARRYLQAATSRHIVLLDYLLPRENADGLLRLIADDETLRRHRYILMPAIPPTQLPDEAQRLIAQWCSEVIMKPYALTTLFASIERAEAHLLQPLEQ
jgi:DNA-binding NtrC family response regulator